MKKLLSISLSLVLTGCMALGTSAFAAESEDVEPNPDDVAVVKVATLMGPTGMGMAKLIEDSREGKTELDYEFTIASSPDQVTPMVINGSVDIAALPINLAAALYQKTDGALQLAAVNTLGVLSILENGDSVKSMDDLKGKTLYATGQGSTPEYILNYLLDKNGIADDVTIEYIPEHAELAAKMASGDVNLGMLPEPNVTSVLMNNPDVHIALDLTDEWDQVSDSQLVQGVIIVSKKFADNYPAFVEAFLDEYEGSVDYTLNNAKEAAQLIEHEGIIPKAAIAENAIPNSNICFIVGDGMKTAASNMIEVLYDADPKSVGGKLPDDAFYFISKKE